MSRKNRGQQQSSSDEKLPGRRVKMLMVSPHDFLQLLNTGFKMSKDTVIIKGVPEDARVVSMTIDHVRDSLIFVVESDEYEEIPRPEIPPFVTVEIQIGD